MIPFLLVVVLVVALLFFVAAYTRRNRHQPDDIDSFRRQIDALSPEARRQTSERMKPSDGSANNGDDRRPS